MDTERIWNNINTRYKFLLLVGMALHSSNKSSVVLFLICIACTLFLVLESLDVTQFTKKPVVIVRESVAETSVVKNVREMVAT